MTGSKPRIPLSSAHQIYGEVTAKYTTPYFAKLLIAGNKTVRYLPKYGGNLQGKIDMFMKHILENAWKKCPFYHAQAKETDEHYAANVYTVIAAGMDCIWRHGASDIHVPSSVGSKLKRENWKQDSGDAKRRYGKARHQVGESQGRVSDNVVQLPCQGSSVIKTRQK